MGLLNYTTEISVQRTLGEIQAMLSAARASAILQEFDGCGNVIALSFKIRTRFGIAAFRLPMELQAVQTILNIQAARGKIPKRFTNDLDQARRVGWRIIRQWLEAQLAIVDTQMVTIDQVFLPYAQTNSGESLYERFTNEGFNGLLLEERTIFAASLNPEGEG